MKNCPSMAFALTVEDIHNMSINYRDVLCVLVHSLVLVLQTFGNVIGMHSTTSQVHNSFEFLLLALLCQTFCQAAAKGTSS